MRKIRNPMMLSILGAASGGMNAFAQARQQEVSALSQENSQISKDIRELSVSSLQRQAAKDEKDRTYAEAEKKQMRSNLVSNARSMMNTNPDKAMVMFQELQAKYPGDPEIEQLYPQAEVMMKEQQAEKDQEITAATLYRNAKDESNPKLSKTSLNALEEQAKTGVKSAMTYLERIEADEQREKDRVKDEKTRATLAQKAIDEPKTVAEIDASLKQVMGMPEGDLKAAKLVLLQNYADEKGLEGMGSQGKSLYFDIQGEIKRRTKVPAKPGTGEPMGKGAFPPDIGLMSTHSRAAVADSLQGEALKNDPEAMSQVELLKSGWNPAALDNVRNAGTGTNADTTTTLAPTARPRPRMATTPAVTPVDTTSTAVTPAVTPADTTTTAPTPVVTPAAAPADTTAASVVDSLFPTTGEDPANLMKDPAKYRETQVAIFKGAFLGPIADQALAQAQKTFPGTDAASIDKMIDEAERIYGEMRPGQKGEAGGVVPPAAVDSTSARQSSVPIESTVAMRLRARIQQGMDPNNAWLEATQMAGVTQDMKRSLLDKMPEDLRSKVTLYR
jgi:hypothetical protein